MTAMDFIALTLAASGVLQIWFRGSLFETPRAYLQARLTPTSNDASLHDADVGEHDDARQDSTLCMRLADKVIPDLLCELLSCPLCLSQHVPWIIGLLLLWPAWAITDFRQTQLQSSDAWFLFTGSVAWLFKLPVYSLAAARLGNLLTAAAPPSEGYHETDD